MHLFRVKSAQMANHVDQEGAQERGKSQGMGVKGRYGNHIDQHLFGKHNNRLQDLYMETVQEFFSPFPTT